MKEGIRVQDAEVQIRSGKKLDDTEHFLDLDLKHNTLLTIIVLREWDARHACTHRQCTMAGSMTSPAAKFQRYMSRSRAKPTTVPDNAARSARRCTGVHVRL